LRRCFAISGLVASGLGALGRLLRFGLAATLGRALVDQCDRLGQRDRILLELGRDRGVDAARGDTGAVAAALHRDSAKRRVIADRLAGIRTKAPARALCGLLRDQRHGAIEADVEHLVAGLQARIGLVMAHERPEAAETGGNRQTGFGMLADLARQREQLQRELEVDIAGRGALRGAGAFRLLAFRVVLLLAELDIGPEAASLDPDIEAGVGVLTERAVGAGFTVGGELTSVAAFRIVRAADEGAELAGLQVELAAAAAGALPDVAAIGAWGVD